MIPTSQAVEQKKHKRQDICDLKKRDQPWGRSRGKSAGRTLPLMPLNLEHWWWGSSSYAFNFCVKKNRLVYLIYTSRRSSRFHTRTAVPAFPIAAVSLLAITRCEPTFPNLSTWQNCYSLFGGFALLALQWQNMAKPSNHITVQWGGHLNANVISSHA